MLMIWNVATLMIWSVAISVKISLIYFMGGNSLAQMVSRPSIKMILIERTVFS